MKQSSQRLILPFQIVLIQHQKIIRIRVIHDFPHLIQWNRGQIGGTLLLILIYFYLLKKISRNRVLIRQDKFIGLTFGISGIESSFAKTNL